MLRIDPVVAGLKHDCFSLFNLGSEVYPEVNVQKEKFIIKLKFPDNEEISDLEVGLSSVSRILLDNGV